MSAKLDLVLIAGFLAITLIGPGNLSVDRAVGIEPDRTEVAGSRRGMASAR